MYAPSLKNPQIICPFSSSIKPILSFEKHTPISFPISNVFIEARLRTIKVYLSKVR